MSIIILYGSNYGTAKKYVEELAGRINTKSYSFDEKYPRDDYDLIVYFGALYAGGIKGLKETHPQIKNICKKLIIVTVGLADPENKENIDSIRSSVKKEVPKEILDKSVIIHLRGGIDYDRLSFKHGTLMKLLYQKVKKLPINEQTPEVKAMIETYGSKVDFVNFDTLDKVMDAINHIAESE